MCGHTGVSTIEPPSCTVTTTSSPTFRCQVHQSDVGRRSAARTHARRTRRRRRLLCTALLLLALNLVIPPYVRPVPGAVTSHYFLRTRPESTNPLALEVHKGIDFRAPIGSPVWRAKSGIVDTVETSPTLGT